MTAIIQDLRELDARIRDAFLAFCEAWVEVHGSSSESIEALQTFLLGNLGFLMSLSGVRRMELVVYDRHSERDAFVVIELVSGGSGDGLPS